MQVTGRGAAMGRTSAASTWSPIMAGLAMAACSIGCGKPDPRVGVRGSVTLGGGPLDHGVVEFHGSEFAGPAGGAAIVNGRYEVPRSHGLLPGDYRVVVRSFGEQISGQVPTLDGSPAGGGPKLPDPSGPPRFRDRIPAEFGSESRVRTTLVAGRVNTCDVAIPAPPRLRP